MISASDPPGLEGEAKKLIRARSTDSKRGPRYLFPPAMLNGCSDSRREMGILDGRRSAASRIGLQARRISLLVIRFLLSIFFFSVRKIPPPPVCIHFHPSKKKSLFRDPARRRFFGWGRKSGVPMGFRHRGQQLLQRDYYKQRKTKKKIVACNIRRIPGRANRIEPFRHTRKLEVFLKKKKYITPVCRPYIRGGCRHQSALLSSLGSVASGRNSPL